MSIFIIRVEVKRLSGTFIWKCNRGPLTFEGWGGVSAEISSPRGVSTEIPSPTDEQGIYFNQS